MPSNVWHSADNDNKRFINYTLKPFNMTLQKLCDSEMCKSTMRARMRKSGQYVAEIALAGGSELINDCTVTNRKISLLFLSW